jgi:hypothetical protein
MMTDPLPRRPERKSRAMRGTLQHSRGPSPHVVIGFAHVAIGALGVFNAFSQGLFADDRIALLPTLAIAAGGLASGILVLGGLWLADGRRRGAVLAVSMDGLRLVALLLVGAFGTLDFVASLALGVAVVWVWPHLDLPSTVRSA